MVDLQKAYRIASAKKGTSFRQACEEKGENYKSLLAALSRNATVHQLERAAELFNIKVSEFVALGESDD